MVSHPNFLLNHYTYLTLDSIWEQDDDSEEDQEDDNEIVQPLIPEPIHTTPPNDDYVAPATKSILDELLEEFGDEILNVTMDDEEADFNPTKDLEELERLLAEEPQSNFTEIQIGTFYLLEGDFTRLLRPLSGLKGLLHTLNATVIPTKVNSHEVDTWLQGRM
ncbi:hypothetical protein Tco_1464209 [Tanacetum coccineum]